MKILFATPAAAGMVHIKWHKSVLTQLFNAPERLLQQEKYSIAEYTVEGYSGLGKDRGVIASFALRHKFDKLFFVDADQSFTWEQFKTIVDSDKPIVAGVVALKQYPIQLNFTPLVDDKDCFLSDGGKIMHTGLENLHKKYGKTEIPVQCMGTAFMCIDVKVLAAMVENGSCPPFIFDDTYTKQKVTCWDFFQSGVVGDLYFGEDWAFCAQAKRAGFQSYINSSVRVDHHGSHTFRVGNELSEP